ncbi:MAG: PVC-type heme-binding CxxCH protein [Pirellulales bacterium]
MSNRQWLTRLLLLSAAGMSWLVSGWSANLSGAEPEAPAGFTSIFNGKDLKGWDGNPKFWRVEEGTITGQTTAENPTNGNTFLIWRDGEVADFEFRCQFKIIGGNSGVQYRSKESDKWVIGGYQADIDAGNTYTGILYEERGRGILAQRGQQVVVNAKGENQVVGKTATNDEILAAVKSEDWNDYTITAVGNKLRHVINGKVTMELTDEQVDARAMKGLLALQLHAGPPMKVQFRHLFLKKLPAAGDQSNAKPSGPAKKIVFLAGGPSHGYGSHEHYAGCMLLAKYLQQAMPNYQCEVIRSGWPANGTDELKDADAVVVYCDGGGGHLLNPHLKEFDQVMDQGKGLVCIHYAVEVPKGESGDAFLKWLGGYFETHWSVNPHWKAKFDKFPEHPVAQGVEPFEIDDEWYFHMRFRDGMQGVTPILSAVAPAETMARPDGPHSGNPDVRASVARHEPQHVAWVAERPNGGRGFGFTGGHTHWNWGDDNFRKVVLNAIVWTAGGEVPAGGVSTDHPDQEALEANQDEPKPAANSSSQRAVTPATRYVAAPKVEHDPAEAVTNLDVHPELEATLFAAEPMLMSPSNTDVDHRGRVWVCEVVNYRGHNGKRPEGDRILILEDTNGDGRAETTKVFYQGADLMSPHGICVLGNQVVVSCGDKVICFTDSNGDDQADKKEDWFTGIQGVQHDHGIHAFVFGPDGKLYFNFGNEGHQLCDPEGNPVVDVAGNTVKTDRKPYQEGMVFRCNLDRTQLETLGWNFRNNWMVTVDSFGTIWQSDNDDDGNRGVRINNVMEFGNYGYRDELTGAGWQTPRTGMEEEIPLRHWHLNDPGVVPNLLQTGAGSPTGITVYEGDMLPESLRGQLMHCDAGPSVTRAYRIQSQGAGYRGEVVNILEGTRDKWFRPSDVKVAPDGSLIVADWYDPGVGGHGMGDLDRGRIFRVTPKGQGGTYRVPKWDLSTPAGAIAALKNPNFAMRYLAWQGLHAMGARAESALQTVWEHDENPRYRARALWLLGKIPGRGQKYVDAAIADPNPMLRVTGLRLARQLSDVDPLRTIQTLVQDKDPMVRRECAIALRFDKRPEAVAAWVKLARQHDGNDRWYLEALGIGADLKWDACLDAYLAAVGDDWNSKSGRDIVWRSRGKQTPGLLAKLIEDPSTQVAELPRYFRSLDFVSGPERDQAVWQIAQTPSQDTARQALVMAESLQRVNLSSGADASGQRELIGRLVAPLAGTQEFVELVARFQLQQHYPQLLAMLGPGADRGRAAEVARVLLSRGQSTLLHEALGHEEAAARETVMTALGDSADNRAVPVLVDVIESAKNPIEDRRIAVRNVAKLRDGAKWLLEAARQNGLAPDLRDATAAALHTIPWDDFRREASELFPVPASKDAKPFPTLSQLEQLRGDVAHGATVFRESGTCAKCHKVGDQGQEVGPALTEIGTKLSRQALYESILYPSAGISHSYETWSAVLKDGNVVTGIITSQTDQQITMKNNEGLARTIPRSDIEELQKQNVSLMPADLYKLLSEQDLVDVVEYLLTLQKK